MSDGYGVIPRQLSSSIDPMLQATTFTMDSNEFVKEQIGAITFLADETYTLSLSAINALKDIGTNMDLPDYNVLPPTLDPNVSVEFNVPAIDPEFWGRIEDFDLTNTINTGGLPAIGEVTIPDFEPTPFNIIIPPAPIPSLIPEPGDGPDAPVLVFPEAPNVTLPNEPNLTTIVIPEFVSPTIPDFDPDFPAFQEKTIQTLIDWQEPVYTEQVIDQVKNQLSIFFDGGSGINPDVEESIFARARDREDRTIKQQEQQATDEWATKGYTAPPGMLVKRIDNIREEGTLKKLALNREAMIKVHQDEIDNLRFAVQQGIATEQLYITMFLASVERLFEVQKLNIQWQIELYGLYIQAFGIQMEEVKIRAQVYEVQVRAAAFEIEVFKALVEGEMAKAEINKVLVQAYTAEIGAREAMVRMYGEQVKAVSVQADVFNTQVNAYRGEIDAYAARIGADKNRFDAYASQIKGESTKADILASEARAYQSEVAGVETGVRAEVAALEGEVSALDVQIRNYEAKVRGMIGRAETQLGQIQANVAGNNANTQRFIASTGAEEAVSKVELVAWEGKNRVELQKFQSDIAAFQANLDRAVKEIELLISSQGEAGGMATTITAGALAAMHVGASLSSSSGVTASGASNISTTSGESISCSTSNSGNFNYTATSPTGADVACPSFLTNGSSTGDFGT